MKTAAASLDAIRTGGAQMLLSAQQRLTECREAMEEGDFQRAAECGAQVMDRLQVLSMAQVRMAALAEGHIVKVADLLVGMKTAEGEIVEIARCACEDPACTKRLIRFDSGTELQLHENWEMVTTSPPG